MKPENLKNTQFLVFAFRMLAMVFAVAFLLWSCNRTDSSSASSSETSTKQAAPETVISPTGKLEIPRSQNLQEQFEIARTGKLAQYLSAKNEIQKSSIFNSANAEVEALLAAKGTNLRNWAGTIDSFTTSHGGTDVSVKIKSDDGVTYRIDRDASAGSTIYKQLATLEKGQRVTFSGVLVRGQTSNKLEISLTEQGSLEGPEYIVHFNSIVPYDVNARPSTSFVSHPPNESEKSAAVDSIEAK